jgi:hypothetical protein
MKNSSPNYLFARTALTRSVKTMLSMLTLAGFVLGVLPVAAQNKTISVAKPVGGFHINGKPRADSTVGDWIKGSNNTLGSFVIKQEGTSWLPVDPSTTKFHQEAFNGNGDLILSGKTDANPNTGWKWSTGKATAKCDIGSGLFHVGLAPDPSNAAKKQTWAFIAGDRLTTNGTSYIDFQFMQGIMKRVGTGTTGTFEYTQADGTPAPDGGRIVGDFVLSMAYSNGGSHANVLLYIWKKTGVNSWGFVKQDIASHQANFAALTHTTAIDADYVRAGFGSAAGKYNAYQFVEAAVNVSGLLEAVDPCLSIVIKSLMIVTKQSDAFNAELADFMDPQQIEDLALGKPQVAAPPAHNCQAGELQLKLTNDEYLQNQYINWTSGNGADIVFKNTTGLVDIANSKPGTYTFTYNPPSVPGYQCTQASDPITFSIRALPLDVDATGSTTCSTNGSITIATPELNTKYSLKLGENIIGQKTATTNQPLVWSELAAGTYEILAQKDYTNPAGSCNITLSDKPVVTINANPTCTIAGDASVVEGTTTTYSVGDAASYSWSVEGDATIPGSKTGKTVDVVANSGSGSFTLSVTITAANSCTSTCTKVVTVLDKPEAFTISALPYCAGDPALGKINLTSSENGVSYQLYDASDDTPVQNAKAGNAGALQWTGVAGTKNYYVIATTPNGPGTADDQTFESNEATVTANPLPVVTLADQNPLCIDAIPVQLNGSPAEGTYSGTGVSATGLFDASAAGVGSHLITYSYTDGNGCSNSAQRSIVVNAKPTVTLAAQAPLCLDAEAVQLNGQPAGEGGTYSGTGVSATGLFNPKDAGVGSHTITYTYTDNNGCSDLAQRSIVVNAKPATPTFTIVQPAICGPAKGSITITSPIGTGYTYSINNGGNWQSETTFNDVAAGTNPVILAKLDGCKSDAAECEPTPAIIKTQENEQAPMLQQNAVKQPATKADAGTASAKEVMVKFEEEPEITAYPNPFRETVNFRFVSPVSGSAVLQVINTAGQVLATPYRGQVQAGLPVFSSYKMNTQGGMLYYKLIIGGKTLSGKVMKQ